MFPFIYIICIIFYLFISSPLFLLSSPYLMSLLCTVPGWCISSIIVPDCQEYYVRLVSDIAKNGRTDIAQPNDDLWSAIELILGYK